MGNNKILVLAFIIGLTSCKNESNQRVDELEKQVSRLQSQIDRIESQSDRSPGVAELPSQDSILLPTPTISTEKIKVEKSIDKTENKKEKLETVPTTENLEVDTIFYFYKNSKKTSVIIYPAVNGRTAIEFFDPFGKKTFEMEEVRLSYSVGINFIKWHENGSVEQIEEHVNPGASIHFYENTYYFDINNNPTWKSTFQYPPELDSRKDYYWKDNKWILQEAMEGMPVSHP